MRILISFFILILITSCSGEDAPKPDKEVPEKNTAPPTPSLIYPSDNLLCLSAGIVFEWSPVSDPDDDEVSYKFEVAHDRSFTSIVASQTVQTESYSITLPKGSAYYWRVSATDSKNNSSPFTTENAFYVEGEPASNYIPFKAMLVNPAENSTVQGSKIVLKWQTRDLDQDELYYDIYFGTNSQPSLIAEKHNSNSYEVTLEPNTLYYWQITSSDGISRSIGDLWKFRTE